MTKPTKSVVGNGDNLVNVTIRGIARKDVLVLGLGLVYAFNEATVTIAYQVCKNAPSYDLIANSLRAGIKEVTCPEDNCEHCNLRRKDVELGLQLIKQWWDLRQKAAEQNASEQVVSE